MSDSNKTPDINPESTEPQEPYTPASPVKRIIAWVGVVYMVCLVLLNLYPFFHNGEYLTGIFPLFVCPGTLGLAVIGFYLFRQPGCPLGRKVPMAVIAAVCLVICAMGLIDGVPPLIAGLSG